MRDEGKEAVKMTAEFLAEINRICSLVGFKYLKYLYSELMF